MCGRFALTTPQTSVLETFAAEPSARLSERLGNLGPRWNVCPTTDIPVVLSHEGARLLAPLRWGFIPRWYKKPSGGPLLINARSETIAEKPAFRDACRERRCLIPADGFYEWTKVGERRQPHWIRPAAGPAEGSLFAFAGVWQTWKNPEDGQTLAACAIVTTGAGPDLSGLHHREPVVIAPGDMALWLGEAGRGAATLMKPAPEGFWAHHTVAPRVNGIKDDDPELIAPWEPETGTPETA